MEPTMDTMSVGSAAGERNSILNHPLIPQDEFGKELSCGLCGHTPWHESPFHDASPDDLYDGLWPWQ